MESFENKYEDKMQEYNKNKDYNNDNKIYTLLPKKLVEEDASYKTVLELKNVLEQSEKENIRNIALMGTFGSGKSSIINTLIEDFPQNHHFLKISLATLDANDEETKYKNKIETSFKEQGIPKLNSEERNESSDDDERQSEGKEEERYQAEIKKEVDDEGLNRKLEYSILQQIVYKEKKETVPNSRLSRINHHSKHEIRKFAIYAVLTIIAIFIVFEPSFARVDTFCKIFDWGEVINTIIDFVGAIWLLFILYKIFSFVFKLFSNTKLRRLNLSDGAIEIKDEESIFNKYLDEILYFFQVTNYDVVVIEDLDRFKTPNIFLKLRELNKIINDSKIVGRHVTFVYALIDDMFRDDNRTKFFDYIIYIIPVINAFNSTNLLKQELKRRNFHEDEIPDNELSEIGFFIQDMRMLINIINEYKQFRDKLFENNEQCLDFSKLLAMIVYKNYFPTDFSQLQYRKGKIYTCINKKQQFVELALENIKEEKEEIQRKEKIYKKDCLNSIEELRLILLFLVSSHLEDTFTNFVIDKKNYSLSALAKNDIAFNKLYNGENIYYHYLQGSNPSIKQKPFNLDVSSIAQEMNFVERVEGIGGTAYYKKEYERIRKETNKIKSLKLKDLICKYSLDKSDLYKDIGLDSMQDVFIRRGLIDEDYYDYISYFYEGMISFADRDLQLSIKRGIRKPYNYHIDKIENFVKELKGEMFRNDAILNNEILDHLASNHEIQKENFELFISCLQSSNNFLPFIAQYYTKGKDTSPRIVYKYFIEQNRDDFWEKILSSDEGDNKSLLLVAYLKYCGDLEDAEQEWLNDNCSFLGKYEVALELERCMQLILPSKFNKIDTKNTNILDYVIEKNSYEINLENLLVVTLTLRASEKLMINEDNLNLTSLFATNNAGFKEYIKSNISQVIQCLNDKSKEENEEAMLYVINEETLTNEIKEIYLKGQKMSIGQINDIREKDMWDFAIQENLLLPTWENVAEYFLYSQKDTAYENKLNDLVKYIEHYVLNFSNQLCPIGLTNAKDLFVSLFVNKNGISLVNYDSLLKSFDKIEFDEYEELRNLDNERFRHLINNGKLPFDEDVVEIVNKTKLLAEYIMFYSKDFIENIKYDGRYEYNINKDDAIKILQFKKFTWKEKKEILRILPNDIKEEKDLADIITKIYLQTNDIIEDKDVLFKIFENTNNSSSKIKLAIQMVNVTDDKEEIMDIIEELGKEYTSAIDNATGLAYNGPNENLFKTLCAKNIIENYAIVKERGKKFLKCSKKH